MREKRRNWKENWREIKKKQLSRDGCKVDERYLIKTRGKIRIMKVWDLVACFNLDSFRSN